MAIAMCILKEKVINHYRSDIFILSPPPQIMPIYSTLGASSEHFWWNLWSAEVNNTIYQKLNICL